MARINAFDVADFRRSVAEAVRIEAVRNAIYELLRFGEENADRIEGGSAKFGSFHYQINVKNQTITLFTCDASGYVSVSLGNFVGWKPVVPGALIVRLRSTLAPIPGFESFSKDYPIRPGFLIAQTVVDPNVMGSFQSAILNFQKYAQAL
jgi:hypothetical protein